VNRLRWTITRKSDPQITRRIDPQITPRTDPQITPITQILFKVESA